MSGSGSGVAQRRTRLRRVPPRVLQHVAQGIADLERGPKRPSMVPVRKHPPLAAKDAIDRLGNPDPKPLHPPTERAVVEGLGD
jgi:hypothetical protein